MDILFLITGFLCAALTPIINFDFLGSKGILYSLIMIIFAVVVLAYVILSIYKFYISRIEYIESNIILSWDISVESKKSSKLPFAISLLAGIVLGIVLTLKGAGAVNSILLALACAFTVLGWWIMGQRRLDNKKSSLPTFVLSHIGIIYGNRIIVFNGYSKAVTAVKRDGALLKLNIINGKENYELDIDIPNEQISAVDDFLEDLEKHFNGENDEQE